MTMTNDPLESYIGRFQANLRGLTLAERQDIVDEIRAHVHERVAYFRIGHPGSAGEDSGQRKPSRRNTAGGALVTQAGSGFSPWKILRAAFAWAMTGAHGAAMMAIAFWGRRRARMLCRRAGPPFFPRTDGDLDHSRFRNGNGAGSPGRCPGIPRQLVSASRLRAWGSFS